MFSKFKSVLLFSAALVMFAAAGAGYQVKLTLDKPSGVYQKGDTVKIGIDYRVNGKISNGPVNSSVTDQAGVAIKQSFSEAPKEFTFAPGKVSGVWRITVVPVGDNNKEVMMGQGKRRRPMAFSIGFAIDPYEIRPGSTEPEDFQKFWDDAKAELAKIPLKELERKEIKVSNDMLKNAPSYFAFRIPPKMPSPAALEGKFKCWDVKVACVDGVPVSGYLTMPANAKPKSLPVIVSFLGAPGGSARKAFADDVIRFDVNPHGFENGHPREYYKKQHSTVTRGYMFRNTGHRNKCYFRGMYLRVVRALEYVKSLPEYDGKTLIVVGKSQGGGQSLVAGGLDPDVKLLYASVPAMCDHGGGLVNRRPGWPRLLSVKNGKPTRPEVAAAAPYFDAAFFARRIKAEAYLTVGLVDEVCAPTSVFSAYNNIPGNKHITILPSHGHSRTFSLKFNARLLEVINAVKQANR